MSDDGRVSWLRDGPPETHNARMTQRASNNQAMGCAAVIVVAVLLFVLPVLIVLWRWAL